MGAVLLSSAILLGQQGDVAQPPPPDNSPPPALRKPGEFKEEGDEVREVIVFWEARVRTKLDAINQILGDLDLQKIDGQKVAVAALVDLYDELDEEAMAIIDAHARLGPDLRLYRAALLKAPDLFRQVAQTFEERAAQAQSTILKEAYSDTASEARKLATAYEGKAKTVDALEAEIQKRMEFVAESRMFISDVRNFLATIPPEHGLETEKLVQRLNQYVQVFKEAVQALQGVADKIGDQPQPVGPMNPTPLPLQPPSGQLEVRR